MAPPLPPISAKRLRLSTYGALAASALISACPLATRAAEPQPTSGAQEQHSAAPATTASIDGIVVDADGAVIPGAHLSLHIADGPARDATSAGDGTFHFSAVSPGPYTLTVTRDGFTTVSLPGTLSPGQALATGPITLPLAPVNTTVDAIDLPTALEQIHNEEHQRLVGILPNFFVSYNWYAPPLTARQKYSLALHNSADPGNLALVGITAGVQQAANGFPGYGQGAAGYGRRYGADLGNLVAGTFMGGAVLPSLFHQDPRYFYKGSGTTKQRIAYALSRSVITRGDNGNSQVNFSGILGDFSAGAISNLYYAPSDRQGARLTVINGALGVAGDALNGIVQEFLLRRFTPKAKQHTISAP